MMRQLDRLTKAFSDLTIGTLIVLVHLAIVDRSRTRRSERDLT